LTLYSNGTINDLALFAIIYVAAAVLALSAISVTLWSRSSHYSTYHKLKDPRTLYMRITPKSGIGLHRILLKSVMKAPQSFFDETDSGNTLNRFSQDMTLIDGALPSAAVMSLWSE
jgi:ATP-binding cassette subfamily C (CFTR/MRP) protein 1